ncbi:hypothetical protein [Catenulispora pinisilvae]|uniref:hypothetical protein n=1 Tax=Catenulispora pinisilvae TaxID=2705253 RepID=UPI0018916050|nr:hypothetical protein [Catenulispora pinisilvae]
MNDCLLCTHASTAPTEVYRDDWWAATVFPALAVPGWYVLRLLRHAEGLAAMTQPEAEALGRALRRLSGAVTVTCHTDVVYATCFGEDNRHLHWLVMARADDIPAEQRRGRLAEQAARLVDPARAQVTAARVRDAVTEVAP